MDSIRERLNNPLALVLAGFLSGLFIGWIIIGWGLWPVAWVDASPSDLEVTFQEDYLRMAIDSYGSKVDGDKALQRWEGLGPDAENILATIEVEPGDQDVIAIEFFKDVVNPSTIDTVTETVASDDTTTSSMTKIFIMCAVVVVLAVVVAIYLYLFRRPSSTDEFLADDQVQDVKEQIEPADFDVQDGVPPMAQYMTTYMFGDSLFDDSFSIDSPSGKFLGECGVGIAEPTMEVGDPKKVSAFEIWLFDQRDIQTVTKVILSDFAFADDTLRAQFETKGILAQAGPGNEVILETATLRVIARVIDMDYGQDNALPQHSFFSRMTIELAVWQRT